VEATSVDRAAASSPVKRPVSEVGAEITRLRKELASAKLDIEILRKAKIFNKSRSIFFGQFAL
jgi:transposase